MVVLQIVVYILEFPMVRKPMSLPKLMIDIEIFVVAVAQYQGTFVIA
jgi:hypothetical protein